jgi:hypothetical protein
VKGSNRLNLNQETMCAALQVWIDQTFAAVPKPKVTKVEQASNSTTYGRENEFTVTVESVEPNVVTKL